MRCYYCQSTSLEESFKVGSYLLYKCESCDLSMIGLPPRFKPLRQNQLNYDDIYLSNYLARAAILKENFVSKLQAIEKIQRGGKLLDIGCGPGLFLETVTDRAKYHWELYGIDINKRLIAVARKRVHNAHISENSFSKIDYPSNFFDCITLFDVLEHDQNLKHNLTEVRRVMKKGGLLVVQAPNYNSLMARLCGLQWDWWSVPDHIFHFTPKTLSKVLRDQGFIIKEIATWEPTETFVMNVKGALRKKITSFMMLNKIISKLSTVPFLLTSFTLSIFEKKLHIGGLVLVFSTKF